MLIRQTLQGASLLTRLKKLLPTAPLPLADDSADDVTPASHTGIAAAYRKASRRPAIYFNLTFAILLLVIAPIRHFVFELPLFPSTLAMLLEWGVAMPACLATAYVHATWVTRPHIERLLVLLIGLSCSALMWDQLIWQSFGIQIPHEYTGLFFIASISVSGLSSRLVVVLSVLYMLLCVICVIAPGDWSPTTGGFHLYFDLVAVGFTLLNARSLRKEVGVSWALNQQLSATAREIAERSAQELQQQHLHRQALQASEERFRTVVESAPTAMVMINRQGQIALVNSQAEKLFGYARDELLGQKVDLLVPDSIRHRHAQLREGFFDDPRPRSMGVGRDLFGVHRDGSEIPVEIGLNPIRTSQGDFVLAAIADITERRRAQRALTDLNATLESQIGETRAAFSRLKDAQNQLVQAEKMASLGGLVAGVAHEINTPIGIGVTAASRLQDDMHKLSQAFADGKLTRSQLQSTLDAAGQACGMVLSNLRRAADLIGSFKRVAADQANEDLCRIALAAYLEEVLTSLRPQLRIGGHRIELDCDPLIRAELVPGALAQIITNLVMNALVHAFEDATPGLIRIEVEQQDDELLLSVADNGKGVAPEVLPKIFDPFFTTRRGSGGTGLGLHIVFNLVNQTLGGTIQARSTPGQGTQFLLRFPLSRAGARVRG